MPYTHLTLLERQLLAQQAAAGESLTRIAQLLRRHPATIGRELRRNGLSLGPGAGRLYLAAEAQQQAQSRRSQGPRPAKCAHAPLQREVHQRLRACHSPEQIAGALAQEYPQEPRMQLSHESIYRYIPQDYRSGGTLYRHLRQHRPQRRPRCRRRKQRIANRRSIHQRPPAANARSEGGHWESDSVVGRGGRIITHVERVSGYLLARKVPDGTAEQLNRVTVRALKKLPPELRRSLSCDNGAEFAGHARLSQRSGVAVYFADPHCPWQRGLSENTNGLLRQFFPKGSDFGHLSKQRLAWVVRLLNNRPRKRLNYQTPAAVLHKLRSESPPLALQT